MSSSPTLMRYAMYSTIRANRDSFTES
jgi:hypothetical protein